MPMCGRGSNASLEHNAVFARLPDGKGGDAPSPAARPVSCARFSAETRLRGASFSVIRLGPLRLRLGLGHVSALLGLAVPPRARAVVDMAVGVDPNLAVAGWWRSGAPAGGGRWS